MKKALSLIMISSIALPIFSILSLYVRASPPVHNLNTCLYYETIQEAIDAPETLDGHTIFVDTGTYYEHVVVDKSLSLVGSDRSTTVIDGGGTGNVLTITANNVSLTEFKMQNSGSSHHESGIYLHYSSGNSISHNIIMNNWAGISTCTYACRSSNNTISGNNITQNCRGIDLEWSSNNRIFENNITNNNDWGLKCDHKCNNNTVYGNLLENNAYGIGFHGEGSGNNISRNRFAYNKLSLSCMHGSDDNLVSGNDFRNSIVDAIKFHSCHNNTISGNNIIDTGSCGIQLEGANHTVSGNNITNSSDIGIFLLGSWNCTIVGNNIKNNWMGVFLFLGGPGSKIYHNNFIDNGWPPMIADHAVTLWDDGYPSGGNYWSDYQGTDSCSGSYQNEPWSDGIGDTSYAIEEDNEDNYPLMNPWTPIETSVAVEGNNYPVTVVSNTTIDQIVLTPNTLHFKSSGPTGDTGYIRVIFPMVNTTEIKVFIDGEAPLTPPPFPVINTNGTHYFIYFEFTLSTHDITIQFAPPPTIDATVDIDPNTLNLKYQGQWITAYTQLPEEHNTEDIDATTISLNETIQPVLDPKYDFVTNSSEYIVDHNEDDILERMVKFDAAEVVALIHDYLDDIGWRFCNVTLTITGEVAGMEFGGSDTIRVIVGDVNLDNAVDILDLTKVSITYGTFNDEPLYDWNADIDEDGVIDMRDLFIVARNLGKS